MGFARQAELCKLVNPQLRRSADLGAAVGVYDPAHLVCSLKGSTRHLPRPDRLAAMLASHVGSSFAPCREP
jgi:hypothetical protein